MGNRFNKNQPKVEETPECNIVIVGSPEVGQPLVNSYVHNDLKYGARASQALGVSQHWKTIEVQMLKKGVPP